MKIETLTVRLVHEQIWVTAPRLPNRFLVEVKHKNKVKCKQLVTFPILSQYWQIKIVRTWN